MKLIGTKHLTSLRLCPRSRIKHSKLTSLRTSCNVCFLKTLKHNLTLDSQPKLKTTLQIFNQRTTCRILLRQSPRRKSLLFLTYKIFSLATYLKTIK
jgi:hypothetical protein